MPGKDPIKVLSGSNGSGATWSTSQTRVQGLWTLRCASKGGKKRWRKGGRRERQEEEDEDEEVEEEEMMQGKSSILYQNSFISLTLWGVQLICSLLPTSEVKEAMSLP